jgi:ureidoglycolate dehydrogenase (NAD+)
MPRLEPERLRDALREHFATLDVDRASVEHVVASMVETSLRGVDSHGVQLAPHYSRAVRAGRVNARPGITTVRREASTAVLDADHAFGHHAGSTAIALAEELADASGLGAVSVVRSTHFGAAAYFALQSSRRGYLAFAFTNADALVAPFHARAPFFGTNPICMTAPMDGEEPLCLDMATSRVSWNKVKLRREQGVPLEPGWAMDELGQPTIAPHAARVLAPSGEYKGFGLGMMVEVLCGLLAGGPAATEILPMFSAPLERRREISHFFAALRIGAFTDPACFRARLQGLADAVRRMAADSPEHEVMVPGDPEKRHFAERSRVGIPMPEDRLQELITMAPAVARAVLP